MRKLLTWGLVLACLCSSLAYSAPWKDVTLNGYYSFEYEKHVAGDKSADVDRRGSFDSDLFDIVMNIQATDRLRLATDLTWEHGPATEDGRGNVATEYAFAEYALSNLVKVRAGKMFTHFGIYNEIHTAKPATLTVKEPLSTNKNDKLGSEQRFYPRWQNGIAVTGDGEISGRGFDYVVQLSNGESEDNPFEEDDNNHKALNGRIRYMLNDELRLGFSFYMDSMANFDGDGNSGDVNSFGFQAEWEGPFGVEFEYVFGDEQLNGSDSIDRWAYSLMIFHRSTKRLTPYLRIEQIDPNTDFSGDVATLVIPGVNFRVDTNMFIKMELYNVSVDDQADVDGKFPGGIETTELKASLSIGF